VAPAAAPAGRAGGEADRLTRVYVEVTTRCNLACRTCVRNGWDEPLGEMPLALFRSLIAQLHAGAQERAGAQPPTLVFAGYGEPTVHPELLEMLRLSKDLGARVEMVTNGTRVDAAMARGLIDLGVDRVWFSVDAVTPERYAAIPGVVFRGCRDAGTLCSHPTWRAAGRGERPHPRALPRAAARAQDPA